MAATASLIATRRPSRLAQKSLCIRNATSAVNRSSPTTISWWIPLILLGLLQHQLKPGDGMSGTEARLANAASIEMYGNVMRSKGLQARADWAYAEARKIRTAVLMSTMQTSASKRAA